MMTGDHLIRPCGPPSPQGEGFVEGYKEGNYVISEIDG